MDTRGGQAKSRRRFLQLLAASPVLPFINLPRSMAQALQQGQGSGGASTDNVLHIQDPDGVPASVLNSMADYDANLASAKGAITVFDLEAVARRKLHVGHLAYLMGTEDGASYLANREGFKHFQLRPRRLVDVSKIDMSVTLFGTKWNTPIILCPAGFQEAFNPEGEVATARAAKAKGHVQMLSNVPDKSIEEVTAARGEPVWAQVDWTKDWSIALGRIKRAEATGSPVLFVTVDTPQGDKREALARVRRQNAAFCGTCHTLLENEGLTQQALHGPGFKNTEGSWADTKPVGPSMPAPPFTWDWIKKVRDTTTRKLVVKGLVNREDAEMAVQCGVDAVQVSNHGGRSTETSRGTIECLPEMVAGAAGRIPVFIDGGFRRGTDIYKALAMGASAVGVGRPYLWGLASFGQEGVEAALDILTTELRMVLSQMGVTSIGAIRKDSVIPRPA